MLVSGIQQSDSVIHTHTHTHTHQRETNCRRKKTPNVILIEWFIVICHISSIHMGNSN